MIKNIIFIYDFFIILLMNLLIKCSFLLQGCNEIMIKVTSRINLGFIGSLIVASCSGGENEIDGTQTPDPQPFVVDAENQRQSVRQQLSIFDASQPLTLSSERLRSIAKQLWQNFPKTGSGRANFIRELLSIMTPGEWLSLAQNQSLTFDTTKLNKLKEILNKHLVDKQIYSLQPQPVFTPNQLLVDPSHAYLGTANSVLLQDLQVRPTQQRSILGGFFSSFVQRQQVKIERLTDTMGTLVILKELLNETEIKQSLLTLNQTSSSSHESQTMSSVAGLTKLNTTANEIYISFVDKKSIYESSVIYLTNNSGNIIPKIAMNTDATTITNGVDTTEANLTEFKPIKFYTNVEIGNDKLTIIPFSENEPEFCKELKLTLNGNEISLPTIFPKLETATICHFKIDSLDRDNDKVTENKIILNFNNILQHSPDYLVDDLNEETKEHSLFARPKNEKVGLGVDGVLHTNVYYSLSDFFTPYFDPSSRYVFALNGRNKRVEKEIKFLLNNKNNINIVTNNKSFCDSSSSNLVHDRENFLKSNGLPPISNENLFCGIHKKSEIINDHNITTFYDDSPRVLEEIAKTNHAMGNGHKTKLFMVLPKQQKVVHYFSDYSSKNNVMIDSCGVLIVDDSTPKKRFLLQLRGPKMHWAANTWNFPGGACAYKENKKNQDKGLANNTFEDPITGALREFKEEAGKNISIDELLNNSKRMVALRSNKYMLFVMKLNKEDVDKLKFIPLDKYQNEVSKEMFNIATSATKSPGYRWFNLDECSENLIIDGFPIKNAGKTCDVFREILEQF